MLVNLAAAAAPAALNIAANFLTSPRQTPAERELRRLSQYFKREAEAPYFSSTEGQSQIRFAEEVDERNRKRSTATGARAGATGEAETASTQAANEAHGSNVNRIAGRAGQHRQRMLSNYMGALQGAENLRAGSEAQWQEQIGAITSGVGEVANSWLKERARKDYE